MKTIKFLSFLLGLVFLAQFHATDAAAQATRTWVSGVGDDANPCSRTAPCKTFAGAISKTAAGGEINVLDPGGFGAVTITKSITIAADGALAGVVVASTNAFVINAAATDVINISGIDFEGLRQTGVPALSAIKVLSAARVNVDNCLIHDFSVAAVEVTSSAPVKVVVDRTRMLNVTRGVFVTAPTNASSATVSRSTITSATAGLVASGAVAKIIVSDSTIASSQNVFQRIAGGQIFTTGNVAIVDNVNTGGFDGVVPLQ